MKTINVVAIVLALALFTTVVVLGIMTINAASLVSMVLLGIAAMALALVAFELCRFGFRRAVGGYRFFSGGYRSYAVDIVIMLLAVGLTFATLHYQHPSRLLCDGRLSAGFPAAFICDASGESPLGSVGRIDWADADSLNIPGSLLDVLFYIALLSIARLALRRLWAAPPTGRSL